MVEIKNNRHAVDWIKINGVKSKANKQRESASLIEKMVKGVNGLNKGLASVMTPRANPKYVIVPSSTFKIINIQT